MILLLSLIGFISSNAQNIFEIEVAPKKYDCMGFIQQTCFKVRFKDSADWEYMYENIEGFNYQTGYNYRILIKIEKIENPQADASNRKISFIEMIEKTESVSDFSKLANGKYSWLTFKGEPIKTGDGMELNSGQFNLHYCNQVNGNYTETMEGMIKFNAVTRTKMACLDQVPSEDDLLNELARVNKYTISGGILNLYNNSEKLFELSTPETIKKDEDKPVAIPGAAKSFYGTTTLTLINATDSAIVKRKLGRKMDVKIYSQTGKGKIVLQRDKDSKAGKFKLQFKDLATLEKMHIQFSESAAYTTSFYQTTEIHREHILLPTKDLKTMKKYKEQIKVKRVLTGGYSLVIPADIMGDYTNITLEWWNSVKKQ